MKKLASFYPVFTPSGLPGTRVGSTPMKPLCWGLKLSTLLIINLLHFRLRLFSQPQEVFFTFKPADIIEALGLKNPIFSATTNYGHFGKADQPWEKSDRKKLAKLKS